MATPFSSYANRAPAVLAVHRDRVLWIESAGRGGLAWAAASVTTAGAEGVANAARAARTEADGKARDVVLLLGESWVTLAFAPLGTLAPGELRMVLDRKARAALAPAADEVVHAALPVRARGERDPALADRWQMAAADRGRVLELAAALRSVGIRPRRVESARLAALEDAANDALVLQAQRDPDGVALSTLLGGRPIQHGALAAPSEDALVQEARSHAAFARRELRGRQVTELVLGGFDEEDGAELGARIAEALGLERTRSAAGTEALARRYLASASASPARRLDLLSAPRVERVAAAAWCVGALLFALGASAWTTRELDRRRDALHGELRALRTELANAERVDADSDRARPAPDALGTLGTLEREASTLEQASLRARRANDDLAALAAALDGEVDVRAFTLDDAGLRLEGGADARPLGALGALERVQHRLEDAGRFAKVEILPGAGADAGASGELRFTLRARRSP
ncbi:MAG: hypothetical protein HZA53_13325 [Planctomycetes bacterium]|nr:hypothetical protein [Planctomycetota bacterium]